MTRLEVFKTELDWIQNKDIHKLAETAIENLPEYFFKVAASSTGKYHPSYALGDGGLVRHTKAAVKIAHDLLNLEMYGRYSQDEKDLMLCALILHDGIKHGLDGSQYTVATHPLVVANWLKDDPKLNTLLPEEQLETLCGLISSHMGQWNTDYKSKKEILPKPKTPMQKMVHQCDYLASRKYLEMNFENDYYDGVLTSSVENSVESDMESVENTELESIKAQVLQKLKEKIDSGSDKNVLYDKIAEVNDGKKNPNAIHDITIAQTVLKILEEC